MIAAAKPAVPSATAILLVEDEPTLRMSLARGLSRLGNVEVMAAGTFGEAVSFLAMREPSILISDIDLPGPSGLDLVAEFGRRDIEVPIILVTAYLKTYQSQIPSRPNVVVLEKPVPLDDLRGRVRKLLRTTQETNDISPIAERQDSRSHEAGDVRPSPEPSLPPVSLGRAAKSRARTLPGIPQVPPENLKSCPAAPTFDELWARGVDALLKREYTIAASAFAEAGRIRPGHAGVLANLRRLKEMGYFDDQNPGEYN